jgi:hypothetical protein
LRAIARKRAPTGDFADKKRPPWGGLSFTP